VLPRDAPEVVDQTICGFWHVDDLAVTIDLDPGSVEVVREHEDADPRFTSGVARLGSLRIGRDDDAPLAVDTARHR